MATLSFSGPAGAVDELNIWDAVPRAAPREFALAGLESAADATPASRDVIVWEQDFAPAAGEVEMLAVARGRLDAAAYALPQAETRAAVFASVGADVAGVMPRLAEPERDLADWVALSRSAPGELSPQSGVEELSRRPDFRQAAEQVSAFFEKVRESVRNYALIVSRMEGIRVAVTEVSWTGDFRSAWATGLSLDDAARHTTAVQLALRTRDLWLRLAATVLRGAFQLAALFAANPVLALPAAYRFVRQIIEQAQALYATRVAAQAPI